MCRSLLLTSSLVATCAVAQTAVPPFELERLTLNPGGRGGLLVGAADLLDARDFRVSLTGHYQHDPLVFVVEENGQRRRESAPVGSRWTMHLAGAYAFTRWLEIGAQVPIVVSQSGTNVMNSGLTSVQSFALGTPYVQGRVGFLSQEFGGDPLDLGVTLLVGLPIGSDTALTRDRTVSVMPRVGAARRFDWLRLGLEVGGWIRSNQALSPSAATITDELGSQLDLGVVASTVGPKLRGELSVRTAFLFSRAPANLELMAGVRYPLGPIELYALGGPGFGVTPGTPLFRVLLGLAWGGQWKSAPPPAAPGPCDNASAHDPAKCPDLDLDRDGLRNADDACPLVRGVASARGCPDEDGDGLTDAKDQCPSAQGPARFQGCPDSDDDGIADTRDRCPLEKGPEKTLGCPPKDTDGDGFFDDIDACPNEKGVADLKGCPVRDTDNDSVTDLEDNCRLVPGPKENQGCPANEKQLVVITREKLVIKEKVFFDTGKSTIQKRSFALLDQVARILNDHPEVPKVSIEGHTDSRGKREMNLTLSQNRADAVKAYLLGKSVDPGRLEAKGFGPDRPIADNKTAAGQDQNRRVEFVILNIDAGTKTTPVDPDTLK